MKINSVIKTLTLSDILLTSADGFLTPIFSIFIVNNIAGGSPHVAGTAIAIYWVTKSIVRIPVGWILDKIRGEKDDFVSMIFGYTIFSLSFFLFLFAKTPLHIYIIELIIGIGAAFAYTPWYGFFTRHIDKSSENFEWSAELSLVGFAIAGAGFVAGYTAEKAGYWPLFLLGGIFAIIGTSLLLLLRRHIKIISKNKNSDYKIEFLDRTF